MTNKLELIWRSKGNGPSSEYIGLGREVKVGRQKRILYLGSSTCRSLWRQEAWKDSEGDQRRGRKTEAGETELERMARTRLYNTVL